jgi:hypothetical protein
VAVRRRDEDYEDDFDDRDDAPRPRRKAPARSANLAVILGLVAVLALVAASVAFAVHRIILYRSGPTQDPSLAQGPEPNQGKGPAPSGKGLVLAPGLAMPARRQAGRPSRPSPPSPPELEIGKVAPDIEGEDIDGVKFKLSDYRGKVVVLDFWGHW